MPSKRRCAAPAAQRRRLQVAVVLAEEAGQRLGERLAEKRRAAESAAIASITPGSSSSRCRRISDAEHRDDQRPHVELLALDPQRHGDVRRRSRPVAGSTTTARAARGASGTRSSTPSPASSSAAMHAERPAAPAPPARAGARTSASSRGARPRSPPGSGRRCPSRGREQRSGSTSYGSAAGLMRASIRPSADGAAICWPSAARGYTREARRTAESVRVLVPKPPEAW